MGKFAAVMAAVCAMSLGLASQVMAFEGGGRKPSEAPLIAWGQHYTGQLNNHKDDANYTTESSTVAIWRLPPVESRDELVVNWHVLPFTHGSGFPICMTLAQGIDDFNWGSTFGSIRERSCNELGPIFDVSGSGSAGSRVIVQNTDTSTSYLEFFAYARETSPTGLETFPYDFTVEAPRHFLGLAMKQKSRIHANGAVSGAVTLANGLPAPDGLAFYLTVEWSGLSASYAASTVGGQIVFPLALPESAVGHGATFVITHPADAAFQAASAKLNAHITAAVESAAEIACARATQKAHTLARQVKRLKRNARLAHGAARRRLKHRVKRAGRKWRAAQSAAQAACG